MFKISTTLPQSTNQIAKDTSQTVEGVLPACSCRSLASIIDE